VKRTVKAWVVVDKPSGQMLEVVGTRNEARSFVRAGCDSSVPCEKVVPCVVTYDDGRKSPPRKRREVRRG